MQFDNEAFTDDDGNTDDRPADVSPSLSPASARPSPRLPPLPRKVAVSDADLSSGSQTPTSIASSKTARASRERTRRSQFSEPRRPWEQRKATPSRLLPPTPLPRKGRIQGDVDEESIEKALKKRREALSRWKSSASTALRQSAERAQKTMVEEAAEFFTRKWAKAEDGADADPQSTVAQETRRPSVDEGDDIAPGDAPSADSEAAREDDKEDENLLTSDDYLPDEQLACKVVKAEYQPRPASELDANLHFPASKKVPISAKLKGEAEGDESTGNRASGIVRTTRNLPRFAINQMEHRLVNQDELEWFDNQGAVESIPDPIADKPCRLRSDDDNYKEFKPRYTKATSCVPYSCDGEQDLELELDVSSLRFQHHPLFSAEHVLAAQLTALYEAYAALALSGEPLSCKDKMEALRDELERLNEDASEYDFLSIKRKLLDITEQRRKADSQADTLKTIVQKMKRVWEDMEELRRTQGYTSTSVNLKFRRRCSDSAAVDIETKQRSRDDDELFSEELQLQSMLQQLEWMEYERKLHIWKQQRRLMNGDTESQEDAEDKPCPPAEINKDEIAELVHHRAERQHELTADVAYLVRGKITPSHQCPSAEQQRRQEVTKTHVHLRIMFNEKEVCKTDTRPLGEDFTMAWGQIFALRIVQFPRNISLEVYETRGVLSQRLAEVLVPVPDGEQTASNAHLTAIHFASDKVVSTSHAGVGCGSRLEVGRSGPLWLSLNGELTCSLAWADMPNGQKVVIRSGASLNVRSCVTSQGRGGKARLGSILNRSKLRALAQQPQGSNKDSSTHDQKDKGTGLEFCDKAELERNPRFSLLLLRSAGVAEFRDFTMVPLMSNEYSLSLMEKIYAREARKEESFSGHHDPIEARQARMSHAIREMREQVLRQVYESQTHRALEDIVIEEKMPIIGSLGFGLLKLAKRHRPLRPSRRERRKVTGQSAAAADAEILVTVLRASNVPVRQDTDSHRPAARQTGFLEDAFECQVRPFVEVMFQKQTARTFVADGPHPTWNQELRLPITSDTGVVTDMVYLNLFDEVVLDLLEDDRERHSTVYQRLERRWLGSLKIPFSTLYINSKIEGTFRVDVPVVLLGYAHEVKPWSPMQDAPASSTYVSFYMTVEPGLQSPEVLRARCESSESPQLVQQAEEWQSALESRYPRRFVKALAMDASGKWVFVPRFLRPLAPPQQLLDAARRPSFVGDAPAASRDLMALVARFVSLIPTLSDSVLFPGLCDIWSTCDQFLRVLTGDEEEHAVLLCNYFLHLGREAYLLLGTGIPEGQTAYVLTRDAAPRPPGHGGPDGDVRIWNAVTGRSYSASDSYGPLQTVGCLVGAENIWANVQKHDHPSRLSYNLSKTSHWKPFFTKGKTPPTLESVQPSELTYEPTDASYVTKLQQKIEFALKESVMKWRKRFRTSWNRYASQVLRKILPRLESMASTSSNTDDIQELSEILTSYKMSGFPLSMSFTDVETVIETVLSTGVHLTESRNVEFALAVHIHPYPSSVLAVWVYIAALTRKG
ncbi:coiled-coil and C2 domain containing 2A [Haemaphysalis longicornis]